MTGHEPGSDLEDLGSVNCDFAAPNLTHVTVKAVGVVVAPDVVLSGLAFHLHTTVPADAAG